MDALLPVSRRLLKMADVVECSKTSPAGRTNGHAHSNGIAPKLKENEVFHVEIVSRVTNLPVVSSAILYAENTYGRAKNASPKLVQMTLSTSEETFKYFLKFVLTTATPVLRKWQRPIHSIDSVACNIFDKVTETVKTVAKAQDEALRNTLETAYTATNSAVINNAFVKTVLTASEQFRVYLDSVNTPHPEENGNGKTLLSKWVSTVRRVMQVLRHLLSRTPVPYTEHPIQQEEVQLPAPESASKANGQTSVSSLSQLETFVSSLSQPAVNKSKKSRQKKPIISLIPLSDQDREASTSAVEKASGFRAFIKRDSDSLSEKSGTSEAEDLNVDDELRMASPRRSKKSRKPRFTVRLFPHQLPYMNY